MNFCVLILYISLFIQLHNASANEAPQIFGTFGTCESEFFDEFLNSILTPNDESEQTYKETNSVIIDPTQSLSPCRDTCSSSLGHADNTNNKPFNQTEWPLASLPIQSNASPYVQTPFQRATQPSYNASTSISSIPKIPQSNPTLYPCEAYPDSHSPTILAAQISLFQAHLETASLRISLLEQQCAAMQDKMNKIEHEQHQTAPHSSRPLKFTSVTPSPERKRPRSTCDANPKQKQPSITLVAEDERLNRKWSELCRQTSHSDTNKRAKPLEAIETTRRYLQELSNEEVDPSHFAYHRAYLIITQLYLNLYALHEKDRDNSDRVKALINAGEWFKKILPYKLKHRSVTTYSQLQNQLNTLLSA